MQTKIKTPLCYTTESAETRAMAIPVVVGLSFGGTPEFSQARTHHRLTIPCLQPERNIDRCIVYI
jgi:hypothetical protein